MNQSFFHHEIDKGLPTFKHQSAFECASPEQDYSAFQSSRLSEAKEIPSLSSCRVFGKSWCLSHSSLLASFIHRPKHIRWKHWGAVYSIPSRRIISMLSFNARSSRSTKRLFVHSFRTSVTKPCGKIWSPCTRFLSHRQSSRWSKNGK